MPFGRKEIDVDEISQAMFGMSAEDVKARLAKIDSVESTVNEVKTLSSAQNGTLTEINEKIGKLSTPYSSGGDRSTPSNGGVVADKVEPRRWDEDADGAFADRSQPIVNALLDTKGMIARREAIDAINADNPDIPWSKLAKEIDEKAKGSSLQSMANPEFWKNVYYVCVGEKRREIDRDKAAKSGRFFTESGSSSIVVDQEDNGKPEDKLTSDQLNAARKSGLTPAQFAQELNSMTRWN